MMKIITAALTIASIGFSAPGGDISVVSDYPGGNVRVLGVDETAGVVKVAPDLRDTTGFWFHFDFTVKGAAGRKLAFAFPHDGNPYLSTLGPAVSEDGGRSWKWLHADGTRHEPADRFEYRFGPAADSVRFAMSIPYVQKDWDSFIAAYAGNPAVKSGVLCKSQSGGRDVEVVRVPCRGKARFLVVLTARHHACETTGNPPMEGAFAELLSGSEEGEWLRDNADCVFVPFMDKDGVEAGDQGKDRAPWDYNRDYLRNRYSSVVALKDLIVTESVDRRIVFLDLHSPFVRSLAHCPEQDEIFSFGVDDEAMNGRWNDFRRNWIETQRGGRLAYDGRFDIPAGTGHAAATAKAFKEGLVGSRYWVAMLANCWLSTCVEFGYSRCGGVNSFVGMRELGANMMKAVARTMSSDNVIPLGCPKEPVEPKDKSNPAKIHKDRR